MGEPVDEEVVDYRWSAFMELQRKISEDRMKTRLGKTLEVLIDEVDEEGAIGRSYADAPEIDGCVFLNGETRFKAGDMVRAKIENADEYDLWGEVADDEKPIRPTPRRR